MCISFDKIDEFIRVYDGTRYLVLFGKKYDFIYNRIRYLKEVKSGITYVISHNYAKNQNRFIQSFNFRKKMTFHIVIILIKSDFNKDTNNYYYNISLEKTLYELPKK